MFDLESAKITVRGSTGKRNLHNDISATRPGIKAQCNDCDVGRIGCQSFLYRLSWQKKKKKNAPLSPEMLWNSAV